MSYIDNSEDKMKASKTLLGKIKLRIKKRKDRIFILNDFCDFIEKYDYDQVLRALRTLVKDGLLIKIGQGIYAKTKVFFNGMIALCANIGDLACEALEKLGVKTDKSQYWKDYNNGISTQVPTGRVIAVSKRVRRKISYNGYEVVFESMV
nr:MAG TPA: Transcriptional regulator, AbiEi antitoxin [Caudoviricetes sp.]